MTSLSNDTDEISMFIDDGAGGFDDDDDAPVGEARIGFIFLAHSEGKLNDFLSDIDFNRRTPNEDVNGDAAARI